MTAAPSAQHPVDARSAIAAAAWLMTLTQLIPYLQPLLIGALADRFHLTPSVLGHVGAALVGATTVSTLSSPLWIRRVNWRYFTPVVVAAAVVLLGAAAAALTSGLVVAAFALLGLLAGLMGAPAFASLGDTSNPERNFGALVVIQSISAAVLVVPLSGYVAPHFGLSGLLTALALLVGSGLIACRWLPATGRDATAHSRGSGAPLLSRGAAPALLALLAIGVFQAGVLAYWFFVERMGVARGVSHGVIGVTLGLGSLCAIVAASLVTWLGGRVRSLLFVTVGTLIVLLGYAVLQLAGDASYVGANLLFQLGWGLAQPAYWGALRKLDATNRLFVAAPAATGAAGVATGFLAGPVIEASGFLGLVLMSAALLVAGGACLFLAHRAVRAAAPVLQPV